MSAMNPIVTDQAWKALEGAYDLHVHVAPDIIERRVDDIDLAREFLGHGMRGFILKSHYMPTAERAKVVNLCHRQQGKGHRAGHDVH
jgi:hypothetical protein